MEWRTGASPDSLSHGRWLARRTFFCRVARYAYTTGFNINPQGLGEPPCTRTRLQRSSLARSRGTLSAYLQNAIPLKPNIGEAKLWGPTLIG
jgi:hypothetical protein